MDKHYTYLMFLITHVFVQFITDSVVAPIGIDGQGGMRLTFGTKARGIKIRTKKGNKVCNYPVKTGISMGRVLTGRDLPDPFPYPAACLLPAREDIHRAKLCPRPYRLILAIRGAIRKQQQ
jgi:hypothetical protein